MFSVGISLLASSLVVTWGSKSTNLIMADLLSVVAAVTGAPDRGHFRQTPDQH